MINCLCCQSNRTVLFQHPKSQCLVILKWNWLFDNSKNLEHHWNNTVLLILQQTQLVIFAPTKYICPHLIWKCSAGPANHPEIADPGWRGCAGQEWINPHLFLWWWSQQNSFRLIDLDSKKLLYALIPHFTQMFSEFLSILIYDYTPYTGCLALKRPFYIGSEG